jgi:hypothetical protein
MYRRSTFVFLALFVIGAAGSTATPQFTVSAAHIAWNIHSPSWICDGSSDLSHGSGCYGTYPASYNFGHAPVYIEDPNTGQIYFYGHTGAKDGGFGTSGDRDSSWLAAGPQGGQHVLREVLYEDDYYTPPHPELFDHGPHFVNHSGFFRTSTNTFLVLTSVFDSGSFSQVELSSLAVGESSNGTSFPSWTDVFTFLRPGGVGNGSLTFANKYLFEQHPTDPDLWIGVIYVRQQDSNGVQLAAGLSPVYIDWTRQVTGFLFQNSGWCEYPWGQEFSSYNDSGLCSTTSLNTSTVMPGRMVTSTAGLGAGTLDFSVIDGQPLILKKVLTPERASDECDSETPGSQAWEDCREVYADCPGSYSQEKRLEYYTNVAAEPSYDFAKGLFYDVRSLSLSTWTSTSGLVWDGVWERIQTGPNVAPVFEVTPTDNRAKGSYAELRQFGNGAVYLYIPTKRTWCEPTTSLEGWERHPAKYSGTAMIWHRLIQ